MASRSPTWAEVLSAALDSKLADMRVALPGRVERYDASTQLADVKPLLRDTFTAEDGTEQPLSLPVLTDVPVVFPGAGGFRLTFPVRQGDTVLLVFTDFGLDRWKALGGEVDPVDTTRHSLAGAVAIPGLHATNAPWSNAGASGMTVGADGGPQIELREGEIILDGGSAKVARDGENVNSSTSMAAWITAVTTALGALSHPVTAPLGPIGNISGGATRVKA